jgi:hypothetical protein
MSYDVTQLGNRGQSVSVLFVMDLGGPFDTPRGVLK